MRKSYEVMSKSAGEGQGAGAGAGGNVLSFTSQVVSVV